MDRELRILLLEDSSVDAELLERELRRGGLSYAMRRAQTRETFVAALDEFQPDVVLADYSLPSFDGKAALDLVRKRPQEIPYIFVSGSIGEERAVQALKSGATDYLLKGHLTRLVPAIQRAVREAEERADHRKLEEQFRQAQKMEAIGRLAGGIAHDFNNILTVILGHGELLQERAALDDRARSGVAEILRAGARAADLTRQLLAFSRRQVLEPRVLNLNAVVMDMDDMLRRLIGEDVELKYVLDSALGPVRADRGQIEQVLMNLAVNARDAMPKGGALTIETANAELGAATGTPAVQPGPYVRLTVSDSGVGMNAETRARLFEPFFTTKEKGKGTGLGLATVYGIIKQSGGSIWVYSEPGRGSTFKIHFPRADATETPKPRPAPAPAPLRGTEAILVVEDEDAIRRFIADTLRDRGYTVLLAADGAEAQDVVAAATGPVGLLLADVVMPRMSGPELSRELRRRCPHLRVLFMSGYSDAAIAHQGELEPGAKLLTKPFSPDALARKVREVLDTPPTEAP